MSVVAEPIATINRVRIEFLFLDLTTCTRGRGADASLERALGAVRETLEAAGVEVQVDKILVASEQQARALRFVSSPTIRVDRSSCARAHAVRRPARTGAASRSRVASGRGTAESTPSRRRR